MRNIEPRAALVVPFGDVQKRAAGEGIGRRHVDEAGRRVETDVLLHAVAGAPHLEAWAGIAGPGLAHREDPDRRAGEQRNGEGIRTGAGAARRVGGGDRGADRMARVGRRDDVSRSGRSSDVDIVAQPLGGRAGAPLHVPLLVRVKVEPMDAVPEIVGGTLLTGAVGRTAIAFDVGAGAAAGIGRGDDAIDDSRGIGGSQEISRGCRAKDRRAVALPLVGERQRVGPRSLTDQGQGRARRRHAGDHRRSRVDRRGRRGRPPPPPVEGPNQTMKMLASASGASRR